MILEPVHHLMLAGVHCDDIAIGAGATVHMLCGATPGMRVAALVLTGAGTVRENEERVAPAELCAGASLGVRVAGFPGNRLSTHWSKVRQAVVVLREVGEPDLVIGPQQDDAHQDHRLVVELLAQTFHRQPVWGYEIAKYESDLPTPAMFVPIPDEVARLKADVITRRYPSQAEEHPWFDAEALIALIRLRDIQCNHQYAEAFVVPTTTVKIGVPA